MAFSAFISFHFGLLGLHFLLFWPFGLSLFSYFFFWAFISFHFWPFGLSLPFILAFWAFISFHFLFVWAATWGPLHKLLKTARFLMKFKQILSAPRPGAFFNFLVFWAFISFHFGLFGLHFLSFWPFGPSFPFILAFWAFISFYFGLLGLHSFHFGLLGFYFLSFWPFGLSFPFIFCLSGLPRGVPPTSCQKRSVFPLSHIKSWQHQAWLHFGHF